MEKKRKVLSCVLWVGLLSLPAWAAVADLPRVESLSTPPSASSSNAAGWQDGNAGRTSSFQSDTSRADGFSNPSSQNPMLNLMQRVDSLQAEVQELRGKLEEQGHQLEVLRQTQQQQGSVSTPKTSGTTFTQPLSQNSGVKPTMVSGKLDTQLTETEVAGQLALSAPIATPAENYALTDDNAQATTAALTEDEFNAESSSSFDLANEDSAYNRAYQFIQNKDYDSALVAFQGMVKAFPGGQYKPDAHYWMGEIYMVQGELDLATEQFNIVYQDYPQHAKASDALLKLGYVQYSKGQWQHSRNLLSKVQTQFPGTASARLASTRLQRMQQEGRL